MSGVSRRGGKKNRKHGRYKLKGDTYRRTGRREKNKLRRLRHHLKMHSTDLQAVRAVTNLK